MMTPARLREITAGFSGKRVLVVGDLMLDHYLWGRTVRISPEAQKRVRTGAPFPG